MRTWCISKLCNHKYMICKLDFFIMDQRTCSINQNQGSSNSKGQTTHVGHPRLPLILGEFEEIR